MYKVNIVLAHLSSDVLEDLFVSINGSIQAMTSQDDDLYSLHDLNELVEAQASVDNVLFMRSCEEDSEVVDLPF